MPKDIIEVGRVDSPTIIQIGFPRISIMMIYLSKIVYPMMTGKSIGGPITS